MDYGEHNVKCQRQKYRQQYMRIDQAGNTCKEIVNL